MKIFGLEISRAKQKALNSVNGGGSWWNVIKEPFSGAWHIVVNSGPHGSSVK